MTTTLVKAIFYRLSTKKVVTFSVSLWIFGAVVPEIIWIIYGSGVPSVIIPEASELHFCITYWKTAIDINRDVEFWIASGVLPHSKIPAIAFYRYKVDIAFERFRLSISALALVSLASSALAPH